MADIPSQSGELNLTVDEGTDFTLPLLWKDENGTPVDLTGYSAALQIRYSVNDDGTPLLNLTNGAGITLGGVLGTIDIEVTKAQNNFGQQTLVWDLEMTSPAAKTVRLLRGTWTSKPEVTK